MITVTDRAGARIPVAINRSYPSVFAVPAELADVPEAAQQLAAALDLDPAAVERQLVKPSKYELLAMRVSDDQVAAVRALDLTGVYVENVKRRFYPFNALAAQVLGFVGPSSSDSDLRGRYGVEAQFEQQLRGTNGAMGETGFTSAIDGSDISLTLDRNIQSRGETLLADLVKRFKATGGSVIVQEPTTGRILAMANEPTFDPNRYGAFPLSTFTDPAVQGIYEPGSVFKVLTMAAGIDSGTFTPETTIVDKGFLQVGDKKITNWDGKAYGKVTMTEVIERSINTGAAQAARLIGREKFLGYLERFGIEEKTGIELPGEVAGTLKNLRVKGTEVNLATAAFGQGVSITPMRLIAAISAIANGGVLMEPQIVAGKAPQKVRQVVSPQTAEAVTGMMVSAVRKAEIGQVSSYTVAGKTGTAQVSVPNGYSSDQFIHNFVGFVPASNPRVTILIKLDKPQAAVAGLTVVPAFREFAQFILNYYGVPPDALENSH